MIYLYSHESSPPHTHTSGSHLGLKQRSSVTRSIVSDDRNVDMW